MKENDSLQQLPMRKWLKILHIFCVTACPTGCFTYMARDALKKQANQMECENESRNEWFWRYQNHLTMKIFKATGIIGTDVHVGNRSFCRQKCG